MNANAATCSANCGTLYDSSATALVALGPTTSGFGAQVRDIGIDCNNTLGVTGIENNGNAVYPGSSEEDSGWSGLIVTNCVDLGEAVWGNMAQNSGPYGPDEVYITPTDSAGGSTTNCNLGTTALVVGDTTTRGFVGYTAGGKAGGANDCSGVSQYGVGARTAIFIDAAQNRLMGSFHCEGFTTSCPEIGQNSPATGVQLEQVSGSPNPNITAVDISANFCNTGLAAFTSDFTAIATKKNIGSTNTMVNNCDGDTSTEPILGFYAWDQSSGTPAVVTTSKQFASRMGNNLEFTTVNGAVAQTAGTAGGSYTVGAVACMTGTNQVGNCPTLASMSQFVGILEPKDPNGNLPVYSTAGTTIVASNGSQTWTRGDFVCTDGSNAPFGADNGLVACPNPQRQIGIVKVTDVSTASHVVSLNFSAPSSTSAGTVTSVAVSAPLAGGPITTSGTISLAGAAGQILAGATPALTATPALGTDNSVAGTLQLSNSAANAHTIFASGATTTNTVAGPATVPTTGHILDCSTSSTTCTLHDSGLVTANTPSQASNAAAANQIIVSGGANKTQVAIDFPETKYAPAADCVNAVAGSAWSTGATPAALCRAGSNNKGGLLSPWGASDVGYIQFHIPADADLTTSLPALMLEVTTTESATHTIIMQESVSCTKEDGSTTDDVAFNAARSFATVTETSRANQVFDTTITLNSTDLTGCAAPGILWVKISRTTDTATNVGVYGLSLTMNRLLAVQAN